MAAQCKNPYLADMTFAYENIVRFLRDFYDTILIGKFSSHKIGENAQVAARKLATQLNPINRNFTGSHCNILAKFNAVQHGRCRPAHPARQHA